MKNTSSPKKSIKKAENKFTQKKKHPLHGKPVIYCDPFNGVVTSEWEALK